MADVLWIVISVPPPRPRGLKKAVYWHGRCIYDRLSM